MTKSLSKRETREKIEELTKQFKCAWVSREKVERREQEGYAHFSPTITDGDLELMYVKPAKASKHKAEKPKATEEVA